MIFLKTPHQDYLQGSRAPFGIWLSSSFLCIAKWIALKIKIMLSILSASCFFKNVFSLVCCFYLFVCFYLFILLLFFILNIIYGQIGFHTTPSAHPNRCPPQCPSPTIYLLVFKVNSIPNVGLGIMASRSRVTYPTD